MTAALGLVVIVAAIVAAVRRVDVRLVLVLAGLVMGMLACRTEIIVQTFLTTLVAENFVVPICTAMGFAHVLRHTHCDQHLVHLLVQPLRRVRPLLIPGAVLVGFLVNIPVISQTSTAVTIGAVLMPLLAAARISPVTSGSALLLGSSIGGELVNPGAPEVGTIAGLLQRRQQEVTAYILPLDLVQLSVSAAVFWIMSMRVEARPAPSTTSEWRIDVAAEEFRINYFRALIPLFPLLILVLVGPPFNKFDVPHEWLVSSSQDAPRFSSRLVGAAMLVGVAAAALATPRALGGVAKAFFEGAGFAYTHIIALIVAASCFGKGVALLGLDDYLGRLIISAPQLLMPLAGSLALAMGCLSGSGMATTQALFPFFVEPAYELGIEAEQVGAVVALGAAAGRTISPVAAVTLMCATLAETDPLHLIRRLLLPVASGLGVVIALAAFMVKG